MINLSFKKMKFYCCSSVRTKILLSWGIGLFSKVTFELFPDLSNPISTASCWYCYVKSHRHWRFHHLAVQGHWYLWHRHLLLSLVYIVETIFLSREKKNRYLKFDNMIQSLLNVWKLNSRLETFPSYHAPSRFPGVTTTITLVSRT